MIDIGELVNAFIAQYGFTFFLACIIIGSGVFVVGVSMIPWNLFSLFHRNKLKSTILTFIREHESEVKKAVLKHQRRSIINR